MANKKWEKKYSGYVWKTDKAQYYIRKLGDGSFAWALDANNRRVGKYNRLSTAQKTAELLEERL